MATEEIKMDHFEQGLQGNIRSMIAGQTYENFQAMYQRVIKVARLLEETEQENRATNFGKRKIKFGNRGPRRGNMKLYNTGRSQDKGKQLMHKLKENSSLGTDGNTWADRREIAVFNQEKRRDMNGLKARPPPTLGRLILN